MKDTNQVRTVVFSSAEHHQEHQGHHRTTVQQNSATLFWWRTGGNKLPQDAQKSAGCSKTPGDLWGWSAPPGRWQVAQGVPRCQNSLSDCCHQGNMQAGDLFPSIHSSILFMGLLFPKKQSWCSDTLLKTLKTVLILVWQCWAPLQCE